MMATAPKPRVKYLKTDDQGLGSFFPGAAAADAKRQSALNFHRYSQKQIDAATALQRRVQAAFEPKSVYINLRKTFIAVNAHAPTTCMTRAAAINKLERDCAAAGIEMCETAGHRIFRIK
jgi:hypothetical protein